MNNYESSLAKCQEINRQVKTAERHQAVYYRDIKAHTRSNQTVWKQAWAFATRLAAGLTNFKPGQQPVRTGYSNSES